MTHTHDLCGSHVLCAIGLLAGGCASASAPAQLEPEPHTTSSDSPRTSVEAPRAEEPPDEAVTPSGPTAIGSAAEEGAPPRCEDSARVERAVSLALERVRTEGVEAALLADCDPASARCGAASVDPFEPRARCVVEVLLGDGRHEVRITPSARTGAPVEIEVWVDARARETGFVDVASTRWALSADARVLVRGVPRTTSHTHGGDPAHIGWATYRITHRGTRALPIRLVRVEWIDTDRVEDVSPGASLSVVSLPPGASTEVEVSFTAQPAYATYHGHFETRAVFEIGDETLDATVEHHVIRREPLRE